MGADGSLKFDTEIDESGFNAGIQKIGSIVKGGAALLGLKELAEGVVNLGKAALSSVADIEQNIGGIETLFGDSASAVIANAEAAYQTAGMSANNYMETVTSFSASLLQSLGDDTTKAVDYADMAIIDMSDNANKMGTSMELIQNAYQGFAKQNYTMLDNLKLGYGGTKTEMERLISDANKVKEANGEMADLSIDSFADVVEAIHIVQDEMGVTGTTALEASETITGSMESAKAAWDNFLNGSISAEEFAGTVVTAFDNILVALGEIVTRFATTIPEAMFAIFTTYLGRLQEQGIGETLTTALSILNSWVTGILSGAPMVISSALQTIASFVNGLLEAGPQVIRQAVDMIGEWIFMIIDSLPQVLQTGSDVILSLLDGLIQNAPSIIAQAGIMIIEYAAMIGSHLPEILQKGIEIIGKLLAGIIQKVPELIGKIPGIISDMAGAFLSYDWSGIGWDIIMGVVSGVKSAAGNLVNAAAAAVDDALNWVKSKLGIASPSKVFRDQVGKNMALGIGVGFEDNMPVQSMTKDVENMIDSLQGVAIGMTSKTPVTASGIVRSVTNNYTGSNMNYKEMKKAVKAGVNEANATPLSLDGRVLSRGLAEEGFVMA
jgi:phage-related protein